MEKTTGAGERPSKIWFIDEGEPKPAGIQEGDQVWIVQNAKTKELIEGIGERLGRVPSDGEDVR